MKWLHQTDMFPESVAFSGDWEWMLLMGTFIAFIETNHRKMVLWHGPRTQNYYEAPGFLMLGKGKQSLGKSRNLFLLGL